MRKHIIEHIVNQIEGGGKIEKKKEKRVSRSFGTNLLLSPAWKRILVLNRKAEPIVIQTAQATKA